MTQPKSIAFVSNHAGHRFLKVFEKHFFPGSRNFLKTKLLIECFRSLCKLFEFFSQTKLWPSYWMLLYFYTWQSQCWDIFLISLLTLPMQGFFLIFFRRLVLSLAGITHLPHLHHAIAVAWVMLLYFVHLSVWCDHCICSITHIRLITS